MPTAYTILFLLLILVAAATWIIPAGSYDYVDGVPVAGTYHAVAQNPQGVGDVLKAAFSGFYKVDGSLYFRKFGCFCKLSVCDICFCLFHGDLTDRLLTLGIIMEIQVRFVGENEKNIGIYHFSKFSADEVFFDNGAGTF